MEDKNKKSNKGKKKINSSPNKVVDQSTNNKSKITLLEQDHVANTNEEFSPGPQLTARTKLSDGEGAVENANISSIIEYEPDQQTTNSGEGSSNQDGSTSQNNEDVHNEKRNSSYIYSLVKSIAKNIIKPKENSDDDGETMEIIFRVHLPKFRHGEPVVVGSIEELGNWEKPKVKLKQYKKNVWNYTSSYSYWYSEPIRVPIKRFKEIVEYKYAVSTNNLQFEGIGPRDNRVLEIQRQNFDIWKSNSHHFISKFDYMFLDVIYESATLENIKNAIWDYEFILKRHRELTLSVTNIQFISKHVSDTSIDRNHFLCFLLGHCPNNYGRIELPRDFKSDILLKALFTVDSDTFPKDSWHIVVKGLDLLIHHNISYGLYEWINIFNIARNIDPQYKFIETITFAKCNDDKYIESCFRMLLAREYDENIHEKIIKWLMSQCKNVKILSIVWRSSNREKQLQQNLIECIKKIISSDDPDNLHRNFIELPDDIRDIVSDLFRKRVLDILINGRRVNWNKSRHQSIFNLLNSVNLLHWTKEEYIIVLEMVSNLEDFQLLSVFPSLLANWIEKSKGIDNKVAKICTRWYKKILDIMDRMSHSTDHKGEYVTEVFEKFSNICKLLVNEQSLLDDLMEITINRIRQSSEKLIFSVTSKIDSFSSEVVCAFTKVIKEKIDSMELDRDKYLLKKVQVICGCTDKKSLEIPNEFCETILLLIMSRLQENLNSEVSLHESTEFWIVILRATGSTKRFHSHQFVQEARTTIIELAEIIKNSSIKILPLQELLDLNDDILHFYLNSANYDSEEIITKDILVKVRQNCRFYELSLKKLGDFYKRFCPLQKSKDVQNYLDELIERSNKLNTISLDESLSEAHWSFHKGVISIAKVTYDLNKSQIFYNVFEKRLNEESNDLSVEYIAQTLMKMVLKEYIVKCKHYENWEDLKFSEEIPFWCNVSNFDDELKLMERYSKICINKGKTFMMTIKYLSRNTDWKIRIENLSKIIKVFKIKENWLDNLFDHGNLGIFSNSIETINQKFSKFDKNSWDFIKELSRSEEFLEFLKDKTDDDLKNLINGVDEHSNTRLIQEGTISSLIQIKQFVYPLMNDPNLVMDTLLKEFNYINPSLASKLSLINSNVMAIKNMYKSIYNKVEYTKEKIQNAVNIGIYEFKKEEIDEDCILELSYPYKLETMRFNISELQDLRSRALLISKPGSIGQMDDDIDDMKIKMEEFVNQVDIAQSIIIIMKKLTQLGHFGYREYNESTKGTRNLEKIAKRLRTDLEIWENITNRAQENCYYLTFYPARHVLAFYDYYTENGDQFEIKETCQTLVSFVNRKAKLPPIIGLYCNKDNYDEVLEAINYRLEFIFGTLEKHARPVKNSEERVISDTVKCGELFVAACDDKSKVPNIIMSFYVNHGFYPEPWQLLICMTSTTEEELSIFIKRCFFASKNGYEGHLFCIANLELLDFELQYYLVNKIRFFTEKVEDYNLALICCSETGMHHHIVDQFSKYVHVTDGLSTVAMETIYRELCPKITCVTSELSGQGKTKFIEQESSKNDKNLVSFLISDGVSYNSLIRQLKNSHIQQDNSLHINIISADNPGEVNIFLFQLLTLGMISNNADIISLPDTYIFIEIAGNLLFKSLPFINCLNNMHLVWNIGRLMVPKDIHSPIQIVCHYLDLYDKKELDKKDVIYQSREYNTVKEPLDQVLCQTLLDKYFFKRVDPCILSFRFLEIFVNVLSDQLLRLSGSSFFNVEVLKFMTNHINIRSTLFNTLLDVSNDFAAKSTKTKSAQLQSISNKAAEVDQLENLVHWDDSNHLLVFFLSQSPESISALYRNKNIVPNNVLELLKSQRWELVDYQTLSSDELLTILESLARKTMHIIIYQPYALSADNLLKMALMLLRTRANIPVVICGEAGCGKTSLISFLAKVVEVEFDSLNLHAGVTEKAIKDFMTISGKKAATKEIWLFFDEINTCNHIGLLAELIAHRKLDGKSIHSNIRLFAACNPYRIRNKSVSNVGLKPKKIVFEHLKSSLVYEVKPLPDQILDYVWDYGILQSKDEKIYIQIMVQEAKLDPIFAELLFASQNFIRNVEEPYSVSLRDVKRAINLFNFFNKSLLTRQNEKKKYPDNSVEIDTRSYVLALGLCYQSRLYERELRRRYREMMCKIFGNMKETRFNDIIRDEQMDYMKRMHCPPNIAFNEALLENVLAAIVCIMCKIPLFIVGAPGSSKSLAIRLVDQNLRGLDSNDTYFRTLPQAFFIPHQGSSSSTSDGIEKVFQKAKAYQKTSSDEFPVISVVLLDEVGLAEISPYNPLKVLHSLLEPSYPVECPTVSVIGISNWRLDNSKNSRALLVQRPNFDLVDLVETAACLLDSAEMNHDEASLKTLAEAYSKYEANGQKAFPNFHGLRDYYALIKSLSNKTLTPENLYLSLVRNFGGIKELTDNCLEYFKPVIKILNDHKNWSYDPIPIDSLIHENLKSKHSRHLMIIGKSDSIVNILAYQLHEKKLEPVVILGSQFPEDLDDYSYSILSKIMMCVEAGRPLILTDLESIYGSLYDLWNQNYITSGSPDNPKYFTRVALGAYANPMLHIHPDFRCILVLDEKKLKNADPPLLNRFEKQRMSINDILNKGEKELFNQLQEWTWQMSTIAGTAGTKFTINDLFIGFNKEETLQSLIIDIKKKDPMMRDRDILKKCKENLIAIATPDGMVRIERSTLEFEEIQHWKNVYFQVQHHNGIADYFQDLLQGKTVKVNQDGHLVIINTISNINTDVNSCLEGITRCYALKLSTFKTESQFQKQVNRFWFELDDDFLILQCDISIVNADCIKLAKFIIEQCRNEYLQKQRKSKVLNIKHACIILHTHRENNANVTSFNFMSGWKQITIESLAKQTTSLSALLKHKLCDIIETTYPFNDILNQELLWCILCTKYPDNVDSIDHVKYLSKSILDHPNFVNCLKIRTLEWLKTNTILDWQYHVASNKKLLYPHSSFAMALQEYTRIIVRNLIAKILYSLERLGATKTFLTHDMPVSQMLPQSQQLLKFWKDMFMDNNVINFESLPDPKPDRYTMPVNVFELQFPFSFYFMKQIDSFKTLYEEEMLILSRGKKNLSPKLYEDYIQEFSKKIFDSIILLDSSPLLDATDLYFNDFVNVVYSSEARAKTSMLVLSYIFKCKLGRENITNPILLHIFWWKNASSSLAAFHLIHECPSIRNEIIMNDELAYKGSFEQHIVNEVTSLMLKKISECKEIVELQLEIRNVLNLCENISNFKRTVSFQLLHFCNDLLSNESIPLEIIKEIIEFRGEEEIFTKIYIHKVFEILRNIKNIEPNKLLCAKQSYVMTSLEIIPFGSPSRLELYQTLFLENPFPLMGQIIKSVFENENKLEHFEFLTWLDNPSKILDSPLFTIINTCLNVKGYHSPIAALFCDVIQKTYFARYDLIELSPYFHCAIEALSNDNVEGLCKVTAIALLKEFVHKFWSTLIQDKILRPVELDYKGFDELINQINHDLSLSFSLVESLKFYFLRDLRDREYSMDDVQKFCLAQKYKLPWLENLPWEFSRLQFNVYYTFKDYNAVDNCFTILLYNNSIEQFDEFLNKISKKEEMSARISLMGGILNRLHIIRATREWKREENQASKLLKEKIGKISHLSNIYKRVVDNVITNRNFILQLDTNVSNSDLLIKSVIGNVIALHSSIPAESSPLAYLLQNLSGCGGLYILTCPSDVESIILSVFLKQEGQFTRYQCKCGYLYLISHCGNANGRGICPECNNSIGGVNHISDEGNVKLDYNPINQPLNSKDEKGYIGEVVNEDINHNLRKLSPISYRILHLFVHSIISAWAPSGIATTFLHKNNKIVNDSVEYCMGHIRNDWRILLNLLDCSEENLAFLLHAILDRMFETPPKNSTLKTSQEREEWETDFAQGYVLPLIKNIRNTATDFRAKLTKLQGNSSIIEEEINQTLPMDEKYIRERLPRLWRSIGMMSFRGFRAYYNSDLNNHETHFPFISIFFKYFDKLEKVKYLWPIVNFVKIMSSLLEYRVSRERAQERTFKQFIDEESNNEKSVEKLKFLTSNFNLFANAWNSVIDDVDQFQCHELTKPKPNMNLSSPIALALVEPKDSGIYICAILEYLIGLQNNFLQEVLTIPLGSTRALTFMEEPYFIQENTVSSSTSDANNSAESPTRYYLKSLKIDQTKQNNFINYKWDDEILQNSDRNLEIGRGQDIIYDLQKIEMELARRLVFEKVHISTLNGSQAYMESFPYHMELFQGYMRILGDIKSSIRQQKIPSDKISLIMGMVPTSTSNREYHNNNYSLSYDSASELLSSLEILLCFVKRTSIGSEEIKINDYVNQWMKLSLLTKSKSFNNLLKIGLCLKHLIDLYELIEEQVANSMVKYIDDKFKIELTKVIKDEIDSAIEFERSLTNKKRIPAEVFVLALKRFMLRFLKNFEKDQVPLSFYINDEGLNLWPDELSEELLENFPESLLICHIYAAYAYVSSKIKEKYI